MRQRRGKLAFNALLKNKVRKPVALFLGGALIAIPWCIEKTKWIPQYGKVFYEMGLGCDNKCGNDKRLRYFQKAVRYSPELSDAHYRSARIYEEKGDQGKAVESFKMAIELDQTNVPAYYGLGLHHFRKGAHEHARRYFLQCLKLKIDCPDEAYYYLAQVYDQKKEYDLAIHYYLAIAWGHAEYVPKIFPRVAEIYYFLDDEKAFLFQIYNLRKLNKNDLADQLEQNFKAIQFSDRKNK